MKKMNIILGLILIIIFSLSIENIFADEEWKPCYYDYSNEWKGMSEREKFFYIEGFFNGTYSGQQCTYKHMYKIKKDSLFGFLMKIPFSLDMTECFARYVINEKIIEAMTGLYSDKANAGIDFGTMIFIGRNKARGKSIYDEIIKAREEVVSISKHIEMAPNGGAWRTRVPIIGK